MKDLWNDFSRAIVRLVEGLASPFISLAVLLDESRRQNLDGSWDKYWERKNEKAAKRAARKSKKQTHQ